jgi:hypothetical protein
MNKQEALNDFFQKRGVIKTPLCFKCMKKVDAYGVDLEEETDVLVFWAECHEKRYEEKIRRKDAGAGSFLNPAVFIPREYELQNSIYVPNYEERLIV